MYGPSGFVSIGARTMLGLPEWQLYSLGGIALVSTVYYVPYTYLYSAASLAGSQSSTVVHFLRPQ